MIFFQNATFRAKNCSFVHTFHLNMLPRAKNPAKLSPTPLRPPKIPPKIAPFHPICKQTLKRFGGKILGTETKT